MKPFLLFFIGMTSVAHAQTSKTSIGFNFFPAYSDVHYITDGSISQEEIDGYNAADAGIFSLSGNLVFKYKIHDRFSIAWGLGYCSVGFNTTAESEGPPVLTNEFISTTYRQDYLVLPVSGEVRIVDKLYCKIGATLSALVDTRYTQNMSGGNTKGNYFRNHREFQFNSFFGLGYSFRLGEYWSLYTEPTYSYTWTPSQYGESFDRAPWRAGVQVGIIKQIK